MSYQVAIKKLPGHADLPLPYRASAGASGFDLYAAVEEPVVLAPGEIQLIPCGFALEMQPGMEAQIRPRSGLAAKFGITMVNTPGTIDADYRGEIKIIMINLGQQPFEVKRGERVAQMVFQLVPNVELVEVAALGDTERGEGGFGHTGTK